MLRRCQESDREELNYWRRRSSEQEDPRKGGSGSAPFSKMHSPHSAESGGFRSIFQSCWSAAETNHVVVVTASGAYCFPRKEIPPQPRPMYPGMKPNQQKSVIMVFSKLTPNYEKNRTDLTVIVFCGLAV